MTKGALEVPDVDDALVVVDKPAGLMVHDNALARAACGAERNRRRTACW